MHHPLLKSTRSRLALALVFPLLLLGASNTSPAFGVPAVPGAVADEPTTTPELETLRLLIDILCIVLGCDEYQERPLLANPTSEADLVFAKMNFQIGKYAAYGVLPGLTAQEVLDGMDNAQACINHMEANPGLVEQPLHDDYVAMLQLVLSDLATYRPLD